MALQACIIIPTKNIKHLQGAFHYGKTNLDKPVVNLADFAFSDSQKYESTEAVAV